MGGRGTLYIRREKIRVLKYESNRIEGEIVTKGLRKHMYIDVEKESIIKLLKARQGIINEREKVREWKLIGGRMIERKIK